jgi:hypothetical protein
LFFNKTDNVQKQDLTPDCFWGPQDRDHVARTIVAQPQCPKVQHDGWREVKERRFARYSTGGLPDLDSRIQNWVG